MQRRFLLVSILSLVGILLVGDMQSADAQRRARRAARGYSNTYAPSNYGYWGDDGYWYDGRRPMSSGYWGEDGYWYDGPRPSDRGYQTFYPPNDSTVVPGNRARIIIRLPSANAQVWIDGQLMRQQGMNRTFDT